MEINKSNGNAIIWDKPIRTMRDKLVPEIHQKVKVFDGTVHILTFKKISNPILYDKWGNPMAQINKDYISYNIKSLRQNCDRNNDILCFDIENY
jgi:hypothetical protein